MLHLFRKLLTLFAIASVSLSAMASPGAPVSGKVRVKLQGQVATTVGSAPRKAKKAGSLVTEVSALDASLKKIGGLTIRPLFPPNPKYAAERAKYGIDQWYEVTFDEDVNPLEARRVLQSTVGVQGADVVRVPRLVGSGDFIPYEASKVNRAPSRAAAEMPLNDPRLAAQWHYKNDGSVNGAVAGYDINLFDAWKMETGSSDVVVAIIDGGVDYTHEDLAANMFVNEAELNGLDGVDDDGNGYVDDVYGFNFCTNSAVIYPHSHGTHVAGTVAAVNNNGIGVAGVAGGNGTPGSGVRMISCQVFDSRSGVGDGDFAAALVYAAEMGATIAQCSWGWDSPDYYEQAVLDAINYFNNMARTDNMTGGICIFATGNNGITGNMYPACLESVVSVAAMIPTGAVAPYSNYGPWVDITAPGGLLDYGESWGVLSTLPGNKYGWSEGTSMACPHVSGVAALLLSHYKDTSFSPQMVRNQLLSSVNDLYTANPGKEGLYGSGYIDAAKALRFDTRGTAPSPVSTFSLLPAQDNITVEWTIPEAAYGVVDHCIVYYSSEPFTAEDLSGTRTVNVDTKFFNSGATATCELTNLAPLTTYYVAIRAVSAQGYASELSEVASARTNAGPRMTVSKQTLDISGGSDSFAIGNEDEGLLRWSYRASTRSFSPSLSSLMKPTNIRSFSGKLGVRPVKAYSVVRTDEYVAGDYPKDIKYFEYLSARIGDTDKSLPNSMAQMYTVDPQTYPDGFNLTSLRIDGANGQNAYMEVYRGGSAPMEANKVATLYPPFFAYNYNMNLDEQLYFAPGESFWLCVHFPVQEDLYPLGVAEASTTASAASNALMSNDLGATWVRLTDALRGSAYEQLANPTWAITARSLMPDWSKVLVLDPVSGSVRQGESQLVTVSTDGQPLLNGSYNFNIAFDTNESAANTIKLPVRLTVSGQAPDVRFGKVVDFGSLLVGQEKTVTVEVFNYGYGNFSGSQWSAGIFSDKISVTNENFRGPDYLSAGFPARSKTTFELTFAPKVSGPQTGEVVFTDKDGRQFKVMVNGVATDPARISVVPSAVEVGDIEVGGTPRKVEFTISNTGKYPLQFVMPKYSSETIEGASGSTDVHRFGYLWTSNLQDSDGFAYDGNPDLVGAVDITGEFSDDDRWSDRIDLGFKFPYYGKEYDGVYVTSFGAVALRPYEDNMDYPPVYPGHSYLAGGGWMTAFGSDLKFNPSSKIVYAKVDGKFVVKFIDVLATVYGDELTPISFHIALCSNGDVEMYYDNYDSSILFNEGRNIYCGIDDPDNSDPLTVTSTDIANQSYIGEDEMTPEGERYMYFTSGSAVRFVAPAPNMITSIAPTSGLLAPGQSVAVKATVAASDDMNAGPTVTNLVINSNDLVNSTVLVPFNANVTGDRTPEFVVDQTSVDFGKVFRTSEAVRNVTVRNNGHAAMTVTGLSVEGGRFSVSTAVPFVVEPGRARDVAVVLPTDNEGAVSDVLAITSDARSASVALTGTVIGVPTAELGYTSLDVVANSGTVVAKPLQITNGGNEPLVYSLTAGSHVNYRPDYSASTGVGYTYVARTDDSSISNEWIDIETNGLGNRNGLSYYMNHDYVEVELPFEFPFYGKKYKQLYIYNTGFVSFTRRNDEKIWPEPPAEFPEGSLYTNIIAPYWGLHSMDESKTAGTYHYVTDSRAVISFMEYGNSMNVGVDFQLVLNSDGTFRFVYKADANVPDAQLFMPFGLAGICNEGGSQSLRLADRQIQFGNAVEFSPVVELSLAPGQSAVADIEVDARLMGGSYESVINVATNVPGSEKTEIPVYLTVNGSPEAVFPEGTISMEMSAGQQSLDYSDPMVQQGALCSLYFDVANSGTAPFSITNIHYNGPAVDNGWGEEASFMLFYFGEGYDWMGNPTGEKMWQQYQYEYGEFGTPVEVGSDPVKFAVPMLPYGMEAFTPGEYSISLTFDLAGLGEETQTRTVNLKYVVTPAPQAFIEDVEGIHISGVLPDYTGTREVVLANYGEGALKGSAYIDLTGVGEEIAGGGGGIDPMTAVAEVRANAQAVRAVVGTSMVPCDVTTDSQDIFNAPGKDQAEYIRALYHPHSEGSNVTYNYGSGETYAGFKSATEFVAPEGGINISQVYTMIKLGTVMDGDYKVDIVSGSDPDGVVLTSGTFHSGSDHSVTASYQVLITMNKSVYLAGGQTFNVVITYPKGEQWPATLCAKQDKVVSDRYRAWVEGAGWFDVADYFQQQYGSLGWVVTCLETTPGSAWLTLEGDGDFVVEPGSSANLVLNVNAATAPLESGNKAMLVVKMNDPAMPLVNIPVTLDKNGSPVITSDVVSALVPEGQESTINFSVVEPEGDDLTIRLDDNGGLAAIAEVTGATATRSENEANTWTVTGVEGPVNVGVKLSPDYGDAGNYSLTLTAGDAVGNESECTVAYTVTPSNRAPEALEVPEINIYKGSASSPVDFNTLFREPDGEGMTFSVEVADPSVVEVYTSGHSAIFVGLKPGSTTATVVATDEKGAKTENVLVLNVTDATGVEGVTVASDVKVYPNPVVETLYVTVAGDAAEVTLALHAVNGSLVMKAVEENTSEPHALDVAGLPAGTYVLSVSADSAAPVSFVIVKN